ATAASFLNIRPFFSPSYPLRRFLHAFPTRRSSDLDRNWEWRTSRQLEPQPLLDSGCCGFHRLCHRRILVHPSPKPPRRAAIDLRDRKSTRLNSSHVSISYAVFCLQKKNEHTSMLNT